MVQHKARRETVSAETFTYTTHVVEVDLVGMLQRFDVTDRVVLSLRTPSGRDKRVTLNGSFLVEPHHADLDAEPWA